MARKYWFGDIALVGLALLISTSASSAPLADIQNQAGIRTAIETALAPRLAALHGVAGEVCRRHGGRCPGRFGLEVSIEQLIGGDRD